jgi:hypothetical protein
MQRQLQKDPVIQQAGLGRFGGNTGGHSAAEGQALPTAPE